MDIVGKARKLERRIARTLDAAVVELVGAASPEPLEIVHAVVDRAEQAIVETGRGRRAFPFTGVRVHLRAAARDRDARARFAAVVEGPPSLAERLRARLQASGCASAEIAVELVYAAKAGKQWVCPDYHVEFERLDAAPVVAAAPSAPPRLHLTVVHGKASRRTFVFTGGRIDMGRRREVLDAKQRLVRTNHIAFEEDGPDVNRSVSRRHAHVTYKTPPRANIASSMTAAPTARASSGPDARLRSTRDRGACGSRPGTRSCSARRVSASPCRGGSRAAPRREPPLHEPLTRRRRLPRP